MSGRCAECGFDWDSTEPVALVAALRGFGRRFTAPLTRFLPGEDGDALLRTRPAPAVWSALEYAAHTRDALEFYADRVRRVVTEDRPRLAAFGFDAACEERGYNRQNPLAVAAGVDDAASGLADLLEPLNPPGWDRVGIGSDGDDRTVLVLARRAVHEGDHHLLDIGRVLRHVREGSAGS